MDVQLKARRHIHQSTWMVMAAPSRGEVFSPLWQGEVLPMHRVAAEGPTHRWHQHSAQRGPVTAVCKLNMTNRFPASPSSRGAERRGERRERAREVSCLKCEKMRRAQPWRAGELSSENMSLALASSKFGMTSPLRLFFAKIKAIRHKYLWFLIFNYFFWQFAVFVNYLGKMLEILINVCVEKWTKIQMIKARIHI